MEDKQKTKVQLAEEWRALRQQLAELKASESQRRGVQERPLENQGLYQQLFENANDAIFVPSPDGRFMEVNQKVVELTGMPREEIIGKTTGIFLPGGFAQSLGRVERILKEGKLGPYELELTTPVGKLEGELELVHNQVVLRLMLSAGRNPLFKSGWRLIRRLFGIRTTKPRMETGGIVRK